MSSTNSPQLIALNRVTVDKKFLVCIFFKTSHCFIIKVVTFLMMSIRAADFSHLRELSFHFRDSLSLRPSPSLNLSSGQSIHLVERPNMWKNEVGSRKYRPNKGFSVNGRFGAFANIMAYSGYHGEIEGSADEAKEWPAGNGFSRLWGTAQGLHSSSCQLTGGCLPRNCPLMKGAALPKFSTSSGLPASNTDRCWVTKTQSPCLSMKHLWRASQPQNSLWDWLRPLFQLPHTSNITLCSGLLLLLECMYWSKGALRSICKSQSHFLGENNLCHYLNVLLSSLLMGRIQFFKMLS